MYLHERRVLVSAASVRHNIEVVLVRLGDDEVVYDPSLLIGEEGQCTLIMRTEEKEIGRCTRSYASSPSQSLVKHLVAINFFVLTLQH